LLLLPPKKVQSHSIDGMVLVDSAVVVDVSPKRSNTNQRLHSSEATVAKSEFEVSMSANTFEVAIFQLAVAQFVARKNTQKTDIEFSRLDLSIITPLLLECTMHAGRRIIVGTPEEAIIAEAETFGANLQDPVLFQGSIIAAGVHNFVMAREAPLTPTFRGLCFYWFPSMSLPLVTGCVVSFPTVIVAAITFKELFVQQLDEVGGILAVIQSRSARVISSSSDRVIFSPFTTFLVGDPNDAIETVGPCKLVSPKTSFWMLYEYHVAC
jgi:hypothetical protein